MRGFLIGQLDSQVLKTLQRSSSRYDQPLPARPPGGETGNGGGGDADDGPRARFGLGDAEGTLNAQFTSSVPPRCRWSAARPSSSDCRVPRLTDLARVAARRRPRTSRRTCRASARSGSARVQTGTVKLVAGQSTTRVDQVIGNWCSWPSCCSASGRGGRDGRRAARWSAASCARCREVAATAHEVTELPLSSGEIGTTVRVPADLTDERTEVGQVGAALNTMLAHVEHALDDAAPQRAPGAPVRRGRLPRAAHPAVHHPRATPS